MKKNQKTEQKGSDFSTFEIFDGNRYLYDIPFGLDPFEEYDSVCGNLLNPRLIEVKNRNRMEIG